ncbi:MAG TPA: hypothetical protein VK745_32985 [Polyangiaceae bacterium]|nr:hypothetical protein [Polyangiaceae bacterium]
MSNQHTGKANLQREPEQRLALAQPESDVATWRDPEWQRLWLAVESRPWRSLALIPASEGASPDFSLVVAVALSRTGMVHLGSPIQVADATRVPLNQLTAFLEEVRRCTNTGERLLVALPPTGTSPITATIAQSTDAAVLCVLLDRMSSSQAKSTVKLVGQSRFLGSAIFRPQQIATARAAPQGR